MKKKKRLGLFGLMMFSFSLFNHFKHILDVLRYETGIAIKVLIQSIFLSVALGLLFVTTWVSLLGLLFLYFISLPISPFLSLLIITLINLLLLLIFGLLLIKKMRALSFQEFCKKLLPPDL